MSEIDGWEVPREICKECGKPLDEHWRRRPCLLVPENTEVLRASGEYVCPTCGKTLYEHPRHLYYVDREGGAVKGCDGKSKNDPTLLARYITKYQSKQGKKRIA